MEFKEIALVGDMMEEMHWQCLISLWVISYMYIVSGSHLIYNVFEMEEHGQIT